MEWEQSFHIQRRIDTQIHSTFRRANSCPQGSFHACSSPPRCTFSMTASLVAMLAVSLHPPFVQESISERAQLPNVFTGFAAVTCDLNQLHYVFTFIAHRPDNTSDIKKSLSSVIQTVKSNPTITPAQHAPLLPSPSATAANPPKPCPPN